MAKKTKFPTVNQLKKMKLAEMRIRFGKTGVVTFPEGFPKPGTAAYKKELRKLMRQKPSLAKAKENIMASDYLGEKPRKKDVRVVKKAENKQKKNLKSINKKPLPARSRSGAASGRTGLRGGIGSGPFGPRVR